MENAYKVIDMILEAKDMFDKLTTEEKTEVEKQVDFLEAANA